MTRQELIDKCLQYPDAYEDYPFDADAAGAIWTVMRHISNRKTFAYIYERDGLRINLKCEPARADMLRGLFEGIEPGYHMNKTHWNTVRPDADVPTELFDEMLDDSYRLTAPRVRKRKDDEWR